jgi:hypothetical protein
MGAAAVEETAGSAAARGRRLRRARGHHRGRGAWGAGLAPGTTAAEAATFIWMGYGVEPRARCGGSSSGLPALASHGGESVQV